MYARAVWLARVMFAWFLCARRRNCFSCKREVLGETCACPVAMFDVCLHLGYFLYMAEPRGFHLYITDPPCWNPSFTLGWKLVSQEGNTGCRKMSRVRTFCVSACHPRQRSASNRPSVPYLLPPPPPTQDVTDRRFPLAWDRAALERAQAVCDVLEPTVAAERAAKLRRAADARTFNVTAVLEGLSDPGNVAAVLRTSEALGLGSVHVVNAQASERKQASRSSAGAEKWLQVNRWESTRTCLERLKQDGYLLLAADARAATPLDQLDFDRPVAFVLGHEHRGVSEDVLQWTDGRVAVRMDGLVESLNVSVAAALLLGRARDVRMAASCYSDLLQEQRDVLYAEYLLKHCASRHGKEGVESILKRSGVCVPVFARVDEATNKQCRDWGTDVTTVKQ